MKLEQLENLKLIVDESVYLSEQETLDRLELAVQQGAGGWGVRRDDGALLTLARNLKLALGMAEQQDETYRKRVLPVGPVRVGIEAGVRQGWDRWLLGERGREHKAGFIGMDSFGASAPAEELFEKFGITAQAAAEKAESLL